MTDTDTRQFEPDQVVRVKTDWSWDQRDRAVSPTARQVLDRLPSSWKVSKDDKWQILVRSSGADGTPAADVIASLATAGIEAAEVEREGIEAVYQFRTGKDAGSGSFLSPPGDASLNYSVYGYHSSGNGRPRINRPSGPDTIMSIHSLAEDEGGYYPAADVRRARRIVAEAAAKRSDPSELWMHNVYAYFRHSYSPDGVDRNVSNAISTSKLHCQCGEEFWSQKGLNRHLDEHADAVFSHYQVTKPLPPAEHHLGYLLVREYYPDHTPREDLIADPGRTSGPCDKCREPVQYEARKDAYCVALRNGQWVYDEACPKGGQHERAPYPPSECCPDCEGTE